MNKQRIGSKEWDELLEGVLKGRSRSEVAPSANFESRFWQKILEREKEPWFLRSLGDLGSLIPVPSYSQVFAVLLIALVIGGASGFISGVQAMNAPQLSQAQQSVQYLSGFRNINGISAAALAGSRVQVSPENNRLSP